MDVDDLISQAWHAVEAADVPEPLQETAFKEALAFLREGQAGGSGGGRSSDKGDQRRKDPGREAGGGSDENVVNKDDFWGALAHESGLPVNDLKDILQLSGEKILVTPPTRSLGRNVAEQARTVISLVAGARAVGLGEQPVNADAVREELERKRCYQSNNFAAKHLGPLKGFNAGASRSQIVLTSKWVGDFVAAVNTVHGRADEE
jgi:hypothetical protein